VADSSSRRSASPGARCPRTTARSTRYAPGSTVGPVSVMSLSAWHAKATTFNSRGTTGRAGGRPSTRRGWSTRPRARRAPGGGDALACDTAGGVGRDRAGKRWLGSAPASRRRATALETTRSRRACRDPECGRSCCWCASWSCASPVTTARDTPVAGEEPPPRFAPGGPNAEPFGASMGYPKGTPANYWRTRWRVGSNSHLDEIFRGRLIHKALTPLAPRTRR